MPMLPTPPDIFSLLFSRREADLAPPAIAAIFALFQPHAMTFQQR